MKNDNAGLKRGIKYAAMMAGVVCCGCDVEIPSLHKATEEVAKYSAEQAPREHAEPIAAQLERERASLGHFAASRLKMIEASAVQTDKGLCDVKADRGSMSQRVTEISGRIYADESARAGDVLLILLRDAALNSLAYKYLGGDFSLASSEFVAKMRNAADLQREKAQALEENRRRYKEAIGEAVDKNTASARRIAQAAAKERQRISEMETRLRHLRSSLTGSRDAKARREKEIRNLESDIYRSRTRLESIRREADRSSAGSSRNQAQVRFDNMNKDIERRYGNIMTEHQVATEYEQCTIRKLDDAMRRKEAELVERKALLESQKSLISSVSTGLEKLGMADLKEIRAEIEKALARKAQIDETGK